MGSILRCPHLVMAGVARHVLLLLPLRVKRQGLFIFLEFFLSTSSCLKRYSIYHELYTIDACWIAVDWWSNSSRFRQESVYLSWT